jgi:hypothetical protein
MVRSGRRRVQQPHMLQQHIITRGPTWLDLVPHGLGDARGGLGLPHHIHQQRRAVERGAQHHPGTRGGAGLRVQCTRRDARTVLGHAGEQCASAAVDAGCRHRSQKHLCCAGGLPLACHWPTYGECAVHAIDVSCTAAAKKQAATSGLSQNPTAKASPPLRATGSKAGTSSAVTLCTSPSPTHLLHQPGREAQLQVHGEPMHLAAVVVRRQQLRWRLLPLVMPHRSCEVELAEVLLEPPRGGSLQGEQGAGVRGR